MSWLKTLMTTRGLDKNEALAWRRVRMTEFFEMPFLRPNSRLNYMFGAIQRLGAISLTHRSSGVQVMLRRR